MLKSDHRADVGIVMHDLRGGGAERVTLRLAEGLIDAGLTVELILFQRRGEYLEQLPAGLRLVDLGAKRVASGAPALARRLRQAPPRALLSVMTHVNLITITATRLAGYRGRLMVTEHNQMSQKIAAARRPAARLAYRLAPLGYRFADVVAAVSGGVAEDLQALIRLPPGKIQVLYNPVVDPGLAERAAAPVDHPWFAPDRDIPVLLGVGRLHPQKDFPTLLRALAEVRSRRPVRLLILGKGEARAGLEALAAELGVSEDVALPGFLPNPYAFLARCDAFVLSSRWEGLPTVVIEALACGAPVVATDCPSGPREILEDGRLGRLAAVGDPAGLAMAIEATLDSPFDRDAGRRRAADFSVAHATRRYIEALGL
jgi:glycosyltransferase involved in cell wall biosynthesis